MLTSSTQLQDKSSDPSENILRVELGEELPGMSGTLSF